MPESISSCGELSAPPDRITSCPARAQTSWLSLRYSTPMARAPLNITFVAIAPVTTVRFGRLRTGFR